MKTTNNKLVNLATELCRALKAEDSEHNTLMIQEVFKGIMQGCDEVWEAYLTKETNDILMRDLVKCPGCTRQIKVERSRQEIHVREQ